MTEADVPSPIDLRDRNSAREWERTAELRPFRQEFFAAIASEIESLQQPNLNLLELGSGPGFLARIILSRTGGIKYTLLDYSAAMHELARQRLKNLGVDNIQYIERNFKENGWADGIDPVDVIVTNQAVHELRHKRHAPHFFQQVRELLKPGGLLLFCDHYYGDDGMTNAPLFMSRSEQVSALEFAGFTATEVLVKGGRALYRAHPASF